jgi:hypothetical protein
VTRGENKRALSEVLEDLEVRLEAYLTEWRRELHVQEWPKARIDHDKRPSVPIERKEKRR